jgi:hypothetical protein
MRHGLGLIVKPRLNLLAGLALHRLQYDDFGDRITGLVRRQPSDLRETQHVREAMELHQPVHGDIDGKCRAHR